METKIGSRGVVMLAVGNEHFGKLCANFAISAKAQSPNIPICLITLERIWNRLDGKHRELFNDVRFINPESYHVNGSPDYGLAKLRIYEHAPYDENLFVDADSLMSMYGTLETVFDRIARFGFYVSNDANCPLTNLETSKFWGATLSAFEPLGLRAPVGMSVQSSIIYFRRDALGESIFSNSLKAYDFIKAGKASASKEWYNSVPDELSLSIGCAISGFENQTQNQNILRLIMAGQNDRFINHEAMHSGCQIISFPSGMNHLTQAGQKFYDGVLFHFTRLMRVRPATMWINKKSIPKVNEVAPVTPQRR